MNKRSLRIAGWALGLSLALGAGAAIGASFSSPIETKAADSGLVAKNGVFIVDFYDSTKLSSTSGSGLSSSNYSDFVKVATGLTKENVVTGVSVTGTVQYGKNGGLTAGTSTAAGSNSHYFTLSIGSDYAVNKCTVYATAYESGVWKLNGDSADSGSIGSKGAEFSAVTSPLIWDNLDGLTSLTFKKDNGSGGNQKRLTIYTIVCEYTYGIDASISGSNSGYSGVEWAPTGVVETKSGDPVDTTGIEYSFSVNNSAELISSDAESGAFVVSAPCQVTVSATLEGYIISNKVVTITYKPVASVEIDTHATSIALGATFDHRTVNVTVNDQYADQGYEWVVSANTVGGDYTFNSTGLKAGSTPGTVTLTCRSTADNSKSDSLVVTITGEPMLTLYDGSDTDVSGGVINCFTSAGSLGFYVVANNFQGDKSYTWSVSGSSVVINGDNDSSLCRFNVVGAGNTRISCRAVGSISGDLTVSVDIHVTVPSVESVTWSEPNIDEFSGTELTSSDVSGWNVTAHREDGNSDAISFANYTLYLGEDVIDSLPYAWSAEDDGKTLHVEFEGVESSAVSVRITQTINAVNADILVPSESSLEFTSACGGSGTADDGKEWAVTSDGSESNFDNSKGIHYGTKSAAVQYIKLTSSDFTAGKITKVVVNASAAADVSATVGVKISGVAFGGDPKSIGSSAQEYEFTGNVSADSIEVEVTKPSSATKALYVKSIVVTTESSSGTQNIANVATHKNAQYVAVKFAKAFNTAMATTNNCTANMSSAWATASSAFGTFETEAAALGETEEAYAKNLIKYATAPAEWPQEFTDAACIEKMVKVYEACVKDHGQSGFMAELRPVEVPNQARMSQAFNSSSNSSTIGLIALASTFGVATIAGLAFMRRRKED